MPMLRLMLKLRLMLLVKWSASIHEKSKTTVHLRGYSGLTPPPTQLKADHYYTNAYAKANANAKVNANANANA